MRVEWSQVTEGFADHGSVPEAGILSLIICVIVMVVLQFVSLFVCLCVCLRMVCLPGVFGGEEGVGARGTRVMGTCEPLCGC